MDRKNHLTIPHPDLPVPGQDEKSENIPDVYRYRPILISQVYANLFSNALKYTEEIIDHKGNPRKVITYGRKVMYNYYGPGRAAIKLNVFSTGRHLSLKDAESIYKDGFVGENSLIGQGTGHGLAFVKYVVELHGGQVGYESTAEGNNFFFILPLIRRHKN